MEGKLNYIQNLRYKLQKRVRRLSAADHNNFLYLLKQFWVFFDKQVMLQAIVEELIAALPEHKSWVDSTFAGTPMVGSTEEESAAIGYGVLRRLSQQESPTAYLNVVRMRSGNFEQMLDQFRALYLEPFYEYVDEHVDDRSLVLFNLLKYKQSCEWFRRSHLYGLWDANRQRGERILAYDLYSYLHGAGVEFQIEPWSASGEADMVASQTSEDRLLADAKVLHPESGRGAAYIRQAFNQIYLYTCDYNQPLGYLIVFNTSQHQLRFVVGTPAELFPRIIFNHKTIFFVVIDVFPHEEPASRRKPAEAIEIREDEIFTRASS